MRIPIFSFSLFPCGFLVLLCGCSSLMQPAPAPGALVGTVRIVDVGATWCSECVYEMTALERIKSHLDRLDVTVLLLDESPIAVEKFKKDQNITLPLLYDPTGAFQGIFHVTSIPKSLVYGCDGTLRAVVDDQLGTSLPAKLRQDISWNKPEGVEFLKKLLGEESCKSKL